MRCISPICIRSPVGRKFVPCGRCVSCLKSKRDSWAFRLFQERKASVETFFVTLTYNNKYLTYADIGNYIYDPIRSSWLFSLCGSPSSAFIRPYSDDFTPSRNLIPVVVKEDVQLFMKRFRKFYKTPVRFFMVSEYGGKTLRPHYHFLFFFQEVQSMDTLRKNLDASWYKGFNTVSVCNDARVYYCAKYCITKKSQSFVVAPFSLMSRNPGIGNSYISKSGDFHSTPRFYGVLSGGRKVSLPRYYRQKFYDNDVLLDHAISCERSALREQAALESSMTPEQLKVYYVNQHEDLVNFIESYTKKCDKNSIL